ncbi:hypothetical protein [Thermotalea metallivorans]|uniref:Uncharacterized protein n=1 Tax=Thermotalea metallivorans TaxID=520762 RepID=A0A140LCH8_9FIRM|nr:hypothetical protein [Thermotalea metallivorans]KXG78253.1 hypothetical protein AN619_02280 [Thermotalea metallivorans]
MEFKIKIKTEDLKQIKEVIKLINEIKKEHSCNCTLLEIEVGN